jgi:hypothetical protein
VKKHYKIAALTKDEVDEINALEQELDVHIMAFEPEKALADLNEAEMERIQALEDALGVVLLVYED